MYKLNRRQFMVADSLSALMTARTSAEPNLVFIFTDDQRCDAMSCGKNLRDHK